MSETAAHQVTAPTIPVCLHFHSTREALHQVRRMPLSPAAPRALRFCVPAAAGDVLEQLFDRGPISSGPRSGIVVAFALREMLPRALQQARIRKYHGLGQIERDEARVPVPLGDDDVFGVATVSVVPDAQLQAGGIGTEQVLPRNSFRLLRHTDLSGEEQLFVAYFVYADLDAPTSGINLGLLPIDVGSEQYRVVDEAHGIEFFSDTLDDLVAGLETLSGCSFRSDAKRLPYVQRPERGDLPVSTFHHFFARQEAARASLAPHPMLPFNSDLRFLDAIPYSYRKGRFEGLLYRNCFVQIGKATLFADAAGRLGVLRLGAEQQVPGHHVLLPHTGVEAEFLQDFGLEQGRVYSPGELADILESFGAHQLPAQLGAQPGAQRAPAPRLDSFYLRPVTLAGAQPEASQTSTAHGEAPKPSTFWYEGAALHYVDPHGRHSQLAFHPSGDAARPLMLPAGQSHADMVLVWSSDLETLRPYAQDEIKWKLHGAGYIHDSERGDPVLRAGGASA